MSYKTVFTGQTNSSNFGTPASRITVRDESDQSTAIVNDMTQRTDSRLGNETQQSPLACGNTSKRIGLVSAVIGSCICDTLPFSGARNNSATEQFVEFHGIRFIGLGAVMDELTPKERVYDTLEQLTTRVERLISIGYVVEEDPDGIAQTAQTTESIPLDVWNKNYPNDSNMTAEVQQMIRLMSAREYRTLIAVLTENLNSQKENSSRGMNKYLAGITAHNLGVMKVLTDESEEAIPYFREAIVLKEAAFGMNHLEVALSWDELGIQLFARADFEGALSAFREAHKLRKSQDDSVSHPYVAMVLNNIACCNFQMGNPRAALLSLQEAREIQQKAIGSSAKAEIDLLHVAIVICNCGYLNLALKQYDEARSLLEEALLIQQSVLDDNHRAVRDTLSNLQFANGFHL